ncbi:MAG: ABC transporter permease [Acidobacteria bacterium]|nr:ABC transporter permease [Acidobacteriota bacterium]
MPDWRVEIRGRLQSLQLAPTREAAIVEELAQYLDDYYAELLAGAATEAEAYRQALTKLHGSELLARELRRMERQVPQEPITLGTNRRTKMIADLWQDLRYGARTLLKNPGYTTIAALMLALGIGANTAIFSVLDAVLLRPLPYADPDRLFIVWERPPKFPRNSVAVANFLDWQSQNKVFAQMAARSGRSFNLSGEKPEKITGWLVSPNYFDLLGAQPALGRGFTPEEEQAGRNRVVVLTHRLWRERFGADPNLIGGAVTLDGERYTVVGVLKPEGVFDRAAPQIYAPLTFDTNRNNRSSHFLTVYARLKPNVTLEQAQAEMAAIASGIAALSPETNKGWGVTLDSLRNQTIRKELRQTVQTLFAAVVCVLLIACANLANLTLARAAARQKEQAIRAALGATRWRLIRQFFAESLLLAVAGTALGALLGRWLLNVFTALTPGGTLPAGAEPDLNWRALLFTLGISLLTALFFGLAPAWQASKPNLNETLKVGGAGAVAGRRRFSSLLIVGEVALALTLLVGAGLLIRSLLRLQRVELGFAPQNVLTMHVTLPSEKYSAPERVAAFYEDALRRIKALPGVQQAALVTDLPIVGWTYGAFFGIEGKPDGGPSQRPGAHLQVISPDYFRALAIPLIKGRDFTERDAAGATRVIIINETLARRHFAGEDPIGKRLYLDSGAQLYEIVGIAGNVKVYGLGDQLPEENPEIYAPFTQNPTRNSFLAIRTANAPLALAGPAQREIQTLDKDQPVTSVRSLEQIVGASLADERFNTTLIGLFAFVATLLAALGLYGLISWTVTQHTREIGVRMALGAQARDVLKLVIGQGMTLALVGVGLGLVAASATMRFMASLLYGVTATDPLTFAAVSALLVIVALLACYVPARRATKVDPLIALRSE